MLVISVIVLLPSAVHAYRMLGVSVIVFQPTLLKGFSISRFKIENPLNFQKGFSIVLIEF